MKLLNATLVSQMCLSDKMHMKSAIFYLPLFLYIPTPQTFPTVSAAQELSYCVSGWKPQRLSFQVLESESSAKTM